MASNWVPVCIVWQLPLCLYLLSNLHLFLSLSWGLRLFRDGGCDDSGFILTPWMGSLHKVVSCYCSTGIAKGRVHPIFAWCSNLRKSRLYWGRNWQNTWQTWSVKIRLSHITFLVTHRIPLAKTVYVFQLQRAHCSQLAQHLRGGEKPWIGVGSKRRMGKLSSRWL